MRSLRLIVVLVLFTSAAVARVDRVEITSRSDIANGQSFGLAGPYEKIEGRVYFKVRPDNAHNQQIIDFDKADRNAQGEVEFSADLYLLKPKDMNRGNGAVLFEVSNRGGKGILNLVNGGSPVQEYGDGFLMRQGYVIAWLGWEYDVDRPQGLCAYLPVARGPNGQEIRGLVRGDFTPSVQRHDWPLGHIMLGPDGGRSYPVDDPASAQNVLTVRDSPTAQRHVIPRSQWSFGREVEGKLTADARFIHLDGGFLPGKIYEYVYTAKNSVVVGLGLAGVRDFLSYLKYDPQAVAPVKRVYSVGISQSGRFLRHFLYQDFNADEQSRQVMDGVIAHVAGAGRGSFNHRFAQPSRDSQPMSSIFFPTDLFPFTDVPETDPETGEIAGLLDAATKSHTVPKIFLANTSYEYWGRAASLIHTSPNGTSDVASSANVRVYMLAGLQHFSDPFPPKKNSPNDPDRSAQQLHNPNPIRWFWRAFITDMDQWVKDGTEPPQATHPTIADGTLTSLSRLRFPKIPGVNMPHEANLAWRLDFGPLWNRGIIASEPPKVGKAFTVRVPQVDQDGNDLGGVRLPSLSVPLATYTGWNLRDPSIGAPDQRTSFLGSCIPFARNAHDREASGDPRLSIAERYKSAEEYMGKYAEAAMKLIRQRFMLAEDLPAVLDRGRQEWEEFAK
jgi:alpha/beta hydrolase family protein